MYVQGFIYQTRQAQNSYKSWCLVKQYFNIYTDLRTDTEISQNDVNVNFGDYFAGFKFKKS